ncbi:MAG TPA: HEAT repeat domain-containing protein [Chloroflexia bacterium]|nr:HEAT repeat domain-containing protein [Chloroflexia bacterium]
MSATLGISENVWWMPQFWVYRFVLEKMLAALKPDDAALTEMLLKGIRDDFCYLEELEAKPFDTLVKAASQAFQQVVNEGPEGPEPTYYSYLTSMFSEFKMLLLTDKRSTQCNLTGCTITINSGSNLVAPGWIYDLILENLEAGVREQDGELALILREAFTSKGQSRCDLGRIDTIQFLALIDPLIRLHHRIGKDQSKDSYAPEVLAILKPYLEELNYRLYADERTRPLIAAMLEAVKEGDYWDRRRNAYNLRWSKDEQIFEPLLHALWDLDDEVAANAAYALGQLGNSKAVEPLLTLLKGRDKLVRRNAAIALGHFDDPRVIKRLLEVVENDQEDPVRNDAIEALGRIGAKEAIGTLTQVIQSDQSRFYLKTTAIEALGNIGEVQTIDFLVQLLEDQSQVDYIRKLLLVIGDSNIEARVCEFHTNFRNKIIGALEQISYRAEQRNTRPD